MKLKKIQIKIIKMTIKIKEIIQIKIKRKRKRKKKKKKEIKKGTTESMYTTENKIKMSILTSRLNNV